MAEIRFTLRLPEDLHIILKQQADAAGRSMNEQIIYALIHYVGTMDKQERRITELEKRLAQIERYIGPNLNP